MEENVLVVHLQTGSANPVGQYRNDKLVSSEKSEFSGCELMQYPEHLQKTARSHSIVDKNNTASEECLENSEQCYQQVADTESAYCGKSSDEAEKQECNESRTLQDISSNSGVIDFHTDYYNEILNYIQTKMIPDNASLSYKILLKKRAKNYSVKEGILFYGTKRVLKTKAEQKQALERTHVEKNSGIHLGVKKMSQIINSQWYWRGQYVDIAHFVRQCTKCTELAGTSVSKEYSDLETVFEESKIQVEEIWKKVEVHLHGPYSKNDGQSAYIATIVDPVSRYIVARVIPTADYPSHLSFLILETICTFGVVKCYLGDTCNQYIDAIKLILKQQNLIRNVKLACHHTLEDLVFTLPHGEEQCLWIQSCLEPYVRNYLPVCETDLCIYVFELNTKISNTSAFIRMFNRKPCTCSEENKENADFNFVQNKNSGSKFSQRRLLRSSVLQCRHCEEVFTSKISFRIHQRKHTEEAHKRGMLEGQSKGLGERERRLIMRRPLSKYKHLAIKRQRILQNERNVAVVPVEGRGQSALRNEVPDLRRAELRASTVEAVRRLLVKTRDNRKRRGKYKKFSSEIQEQMARYAMEHGSLLTVRHFSEKLGVIVSESTVRNIVKWYQCFTPEIKEEIGRFAAAFGIEAAASHFSDRLGREVRFGLIRKFKKIYLSHCLDPKQCKSGKKTDKIKVSSTGGIYKPQGDLILCSSNMKEEIGHYASGCSAPQPVGNFSQQCSIHAKDNAHKCGTSCKDKLKAVQEQQIPIINQQHLLQHSQSSSEQQAVHQQQHQHHLQHQLHPSQSSHSHHYQHQAHSHLHMDQQQQQQEQQMQQHDSVPCDPSVALLSVQHNSNSGLQEAAIQSSNQTIDILQTSLNLLNNPQLNNSTAIIYNTPYQIPSTPHLSSNQLVSLSQQQNTSISFPTTNQCSDGNISTTGPLSYQQQEVPISASVIINQNMATVQTFPNTQIYPAFAQAHTVQPGGLAVSDNNLTLPPAGNQIPSLSHHPPAVPTHSNLPTITVAVASLPPESHFQVTNNSPAVVLSQPLPQPILVSHSQSGTTLLQHLIDSQPSLQGAHAQMAQQLINEVHGNADTSSPFDQVVEQHHVASDTLPHAMNSNISIVPYDTATHFASESRSASLPLPREMECVESLEQKGINGYGQLQSVETQLTAVKEQNGTELPVKASVLESQLTPTVLCHNNISKGDEQNEDATLKIDCSESSSVRGQNEKNTEKGSINLKNSGKRNVRKKDKKAGGSGKNKTNEQKRGTYTIYSPEIRAEMGKYAAEHGSQKACDYFLRKHGYNVAESTMRGLRDKYLKKRELCSLGSDGEVMSLGYAPRGRPMRLGQYDEVVQECMQELVKSGEKISSFLAIATAKHVLMQYEPHLLEENGGKIKLNVTWAKSFLKRSGIKNYS